jgi:hypothetical protein
MRHELKTLANPDARGPGRGGLGRDGHTAWLVPGDPVLSVTDHLVARPGRIRGGCG